MSDGIWFQDEAGYFKSPTSTNHPFERTSKLKFKPEKFDTIQEVQYILQDILEMLEEKNTAYGDSALNPLRLFSRTDAIESLCVRIDDKLNRIKNKGITPDTEDSVKDLIGYLVLLQVAQNRKGA
jgi:hypothetical protein